jgi:hypothetical protein
MDMCAIQKFLFQLYIWTHKDTQVKGQEYGLERRVGMPAIQVRSSAGTASIHLDVQVYPLRHEHFQMDMCAIQKFLFQLYVWTHKDTQVSGQEFGLVVRMAVWHASDPWIQVRSSAGTASIHLGVYTYTLSAMSIFRWICVPYKSS